MMAVHLKKEKQQDLDAVDAQPKWLNWCRLCATQNLSQEESLPIFTKNEKGKTGAELATYVGKYFWVNVCML